jgi:tRNA dimethylallyltransferase
VKSKTLIIIVGPTGIGKTGLAVEIAEKLKTEIISCDSRQIYKEMRIGSARPDEAQLSRVIHHFIATLSIHDYFSAGKYEIEVLQLLEGLFRVYDSVVMVGGSGLYVDAVTKGIDDLPDIDPEIRSNLLHRCSEEGIAGLRMELLKVDPEYCKNADIRNPKRIFKALEVFYMTGKPYSELLTRPSKTRDFNMVKIGLNRDRKELYKIIDNRVDAMLQNGLLNEVKGLYSSRHLNALNTVGYKELFDYLYNKISYEKAVELIKRNSRRYAKRQITWFSRDKEIVWFRPEEKEKILEFIQK